MYAKQHNKLYVGFIDYEKASDSVLQSGLVYKLHVWHKRKILQSHKINVNASQLIKTLQQSCFLVTKEYNKVMA